MLQASIEYLRYLEQCVTDLKVATGMDLDTAVQKAPPTFQQPSQLQRDPFEHDSTDDDDDENSDVGMKESSEKPSIQTDYQAQTPSAYSSPDSTAPSPALDVYRCRKVTTYTLLVSAFPSPATGLHSLAGCSGLHLSTRPASTSPNLTSSKEAEEEATETLLMLRKDRRSTNASISSGHGRGMSVKDLLSS